MGITSQREVIDRGRVITLTIFFSLVISVFAVVIFLISPQSSEIKEQYLIEKDIDSINKVYNAMMEVFNDKSIANAPEALWNVSLHDFSQMTTLQEVGRVLRKKLNVESLDELEGDGFKSMTFKGSRYIIWMNEGTGEIHLRVVSNDLSRHEDVEY